MTQPLWVATRKGLFQLHAHDGWRLGPPSFLGDPVSMVLDDARDGGGFAFGLQTRRQRLLAFLLKAFLLVSFASIGFHQTHRTQHFAQTGGELAFALALLPGEGFELFV